MDAAGLTAAGAGERIAPPRLRALASFTRLSALGGTLILPLLGAASATRAELPPAPVMAGLLVVGVAYHLFAYLLNDVIDLPIDATEPRRVASPLVRGTVGRGQALAVALAQLPVAFGATVWLGGDVLAHAALALAVALMAVYDIWGKRCGVPPLTDTAQGLGWAALAAWGAAVTGPWTAATVFVCAFVTVFIIMANGVHGSLRDLHNDHRCGVRSTAIVMGARPHSATSLFVPRSLIVYATVLQAALIGGTALGLFANVADLTGHAWLTSALVLGTLAALSSWLLAAAVRSAHDMAALRAAGMLHLVVTLGCPIALLAPGVDPSFAALLAASYVTPLLAHGWLPGALSWGGRRATAGARRTMALAQLTRGHNCLAGLLATLLGGYLAAGAAALSDARAWRAAVAVALIVAAGNVLNDCQDVGVDAWNQPARPLPSGRVSRPSAMRWAAVLAAGGVSAACTVGVEAALVAAAAVLLALAYARRLKSTALAGNAVVAFLSAATIPYGAFAVTGRVPLPAVAASVLVFLFMLAFEVLKTVEDREADGQAGLSTVATRFGAPAALGVYRVVAAAFALAAVVPAALGMGARGYLPAIVAGGVAPLAGAIALLRRSVTEHSVSTGLTLTKAAWFGGLAALVLLR